MAELRANSGDFGLDGPNFVRGCQRVCVAKIGRRQHNCNPGGRDHLSAGERQRHCLRGAKSVDDFDVNRAGAAFADAVGQAAAAGEDGGNRRVAMIQAEQLLGVVGRRNVAMEGVEANQIGVPLGRAGVDVDQQRGVGRQHNHVGVALHAGHKRGVAECAAEVRGRAAFLRGVLADKNLRAAPVIGVVMVRVGFKVPGGAVEMVVHHVRPAAGNRRGRNNLEVRVLDPDRIVKLGEAGLIAAALVKKVFIADFHIGNAKRGGMTVLDPDQAPFRVGAAGGILNLVKRVLHIRRQRRPGGDMLAAQRVAGAHRKHRRHVQVLAPL